MAKIMRATIEVESELRDEEVALIESGDVTAVRAAETIRKALYCEIFDTENDIVTVHVEFVEEDE